MEDLSEILRLSEEEYINQQISAINSTPVISATSTKDDKAGYIADVELYRFKNFKKIRYTAGSKLTCCILIFTMPEFYDLFIYLIERLRFLAPNKYGELLLEIELALNSKHTIETIMAQNLSYIIIKFMRLVIKYIHMPKYDHIWEYVSHIFRIQITIHTKNHEEKYCACTAPLANLNLLEQAGNYHILVIDGTREQQAKIKTNALIKELTELREQEYITSTIKEYILGNVASNDIQWIYSESVKDSTLDLLKKIAATY